MVGPRPDGSLVAAAAGKLFTVGTDGVTTPFGAYSTEPGPESYIALSSGLAMNDVSCGWEAGDVYALELTTPPLGVVRVTADGRPSRFVDTPQLDFLGGIAFDATGRFGNALLIAGRKAGKTVILAADCRGKVRTVTDNGPVIEGGMAVAPQVFGDHGGDLIAVDENSGDVVFIRFDGTSGVLISSGLPAGGDVGVESLGFVPVDFVNRGATAYMADRRSPGSPTEGTDSIWRLTNDQLTHVGIDDNDLLVSVEGGGQTIIVRCRTTCRILPLGQAPTSHVEGHITVVLGPPLPPMGGYARTGSAMFAISTVVLVAGGLALFLVHRKRSPGRREPDTA